MPFCRTLQLTVFAACQAVALSACTPARACDYVAAPNGSDHTAGTVGAPFRTAQRVVKALRPGQTGCLRAGTYSDEVDGPFVVNFKRGGRPGTPVTLRSYPGERATLRGVVVVSNGADNVVISGFTIDGRRRRGSDRPVAIQLMARDTVLQGNDITDPIANCVTLGVDGWGTAVDNVIRGNVFHDCGTRRDGLHDHAIYANDAVGGQIVDNTFLRAAAFAVQFYGRNVGVRVAHNVMLDNGGGVIFSGYGSRTSSWNVVERNVIARSLLRPGVQSWWGGRMGTGNVARTNCVFGNAGGDIDLAGGGFSASGNVTVDGAACRRVAGGVTAARLASASRLRAG